MKDHPANIHDMLRRAIRAQVELGLGEVIVTGPPVNLEASDLVAQMSSVRKVSQTADIFGQAVAAPTMPQYASLEDHFGAICDCHLCPLGKTRNKLVYGAGNPEADLIFVGEGPGADEDRIGEPFVGRAGQLLDRILAAIQLSREQVYIGNIVKCRPPNNRDPLPEEMESCFPHLLEQIRIIKPKLICCLGRMAAQALLNTKTPLGKLRKQWHDFHGIQTLVTYHPAALLRFASYKRDTWEDMQMLKARLDELTGV